MLVRLALIFAVAVLPPTSLVWADEASTLPQLQIAQTDNAEITFWETVKDSKDPAELEAYLSAYPNGKFAPLAKLRVKKLKGSVPSAEGQVSKKRAIERTEAATRALAQFREATDFIYREHLRRVTFADLVIPALSGVLKKFPSDEANQLFGGPGKERCEEAPNNLVRCLDLYEEVFDLIAVRHQGKELKIVNGSIEALLKKLGPHNALYTREQVEEFSVQRRGAFAGIGAEVTMEKGVVKIVAPLADSPAERAGIQAGDLVTKIDGQAVIGLTLSEAVSKMRGKVGTSVTLTVYRSSADASYDVNVVRANVKLKTVDFRAEQNVGYIRVKRMSEKTGEEFRSAVKSLKATVGADFQGAIIDLRNNPGGLITQTIEVADALLDKGIIVISASRDRSKDRIDRAQAGDILQGRKIAVLINGGTASGAEIIASALSEHKRATLIGTRTFGKGSVQTIKPLKSRGAVRLTTAEYLTPLGHSIQAKGIDPSIVVEMAMPQELTGKYGSEADLKNHLPSKDGQEKTGSSAYVPKDKSKDTQLQYALRSFFSIKGSPRSELESATTETKIRDLEKLD